MKKEFVCISCPVGCRLTVWEDEDGAVQVQGNTCPRGKAYGVQEFTAPMRTVTSSVPVQHGEQLMCSVKTDAPVPKARIPEVLAAIRRAGVPQARTRPPPQTAALPRQRAGTSGRRSTRRTRG